MQVLTAKTNKQWQAIQPEPDKTAESVENESISKSNEKTKDEIYRVLSECFRCNNLIVLTGLGTSLYVNVKEGLGNSRETIDGKRIAPMMWDLWEKAKEKAGSNFEKVKRIVHYNTTDKENIEILLSKCKTASDFLEDDNKELIEQFIADTEKIIREEVSFLQPNDEVPHHLELLRRIARRSNRKSRAKLFTTNYDLCFEYAARQGRYMVIDGFSHTDPSVFDATYYSYDIVRREPGTESLIPVENVFHLYKLHGSIDWTRSDESGEIEKKQTDKPLLVYPRHTKYELAFEQPYFEMMAALQAALREPQTGLLVLGFGFNDNHISEPIWSAIRSNQHMNVVICDPALKDMGNTTKTNSYLGDISKLIINGDERLAMISAKFEEMIEMIPDIAAETELELHMMRLRKMQGRGDE